MGTSAGRVVGSDGLVYLQVMDLEVNERYFRSDDGGRTWQVASDIPASVSTGLNGIGGGEASAACDPSAAQVCYRISRDGLDESRDGGGSWQPASAPLAVQTYSPWARGAPLRSLVFVASGPDAGACNLVVALGPDGVLVRLSDGAWLHHSLDDLFEVLRVDE